MGTKITVRRSRRKTISIEIRPDLGVVLRAPLRMTKREIEAFLREHEDWIRTHLEKMRQRQKEAAVRPEDHLTEAQLRNLAEQALLVIPKKAARYAAELGVTYGRITIRNQKTRWGSCSAKGNLNFNCLLMLTPDEVINYVVVHELCHRREMNHSKAFWQLVESVIPDYKIQKKWLKDHGMAIMSRCGG